MQKYIDNLDDFEDDDFGLGGMAGTADYCGGRDYVDTVDMRVAGGTVRGGEGDETGQYRFGN